jgi:hypothetical protein
MADPQRCTKRKLEEIFDDESEESSESSDSEDESVTLKVVLLELMARTFTDESAITRRKNIERSRFDFAHQLRADFFLPNAPYEEIFRKIFRMSRSLFRSILQNLCQNYAEFRQSADAAGLVGFSSEQKLCAVLEYLVSGRSGDNLDPQYRMAKQTLFKYVDIFCEAIIALYSAEWLRAPNDEELAQLLTENGRRGFPGLIGSLDCMHWEWKNCPIAWAGQFKGRKDHPSVILEAVADYHLRIWHCFFGMAGSHNDLNVLNHSHLLYDRINGTTPSVNFVVNGKSYDSTYFLTDGIYPNWSTFIKPFPMPSNEKEKFFTKMQMAVRKDVERTFGVLQARFKIVQYPALTWSRTVLSKVMQTCCILHNMILNDDDFKIDVDEADIPAIHRPEREHGEAVRGWNDRVIQSNISSLMNSQSMSRLRADLVEHQWAMKGRGDLAL